jgi:hypothetical protein
VNENNIKQNTAELGKAEHRLSKMKQELSALEAKEKSLQTLADSMSLLVSSDDELLSRYQDNLLAFKEYHPDIYDFFKSYEPEKYIVDALDGFVNAINVETGAYFYDYPSYLLTKIQFDKFKKSPNIKKFNFNSQENNEANFMHVQCMETMLRLLPEQSTPINHDDKIKNLSTLMVFGVGAGYHIEQFSQQSTIACLYIIEPDLDLFFLSLFAVNWLSILSTFDRKGTQVYISLGKQKDTFFDELMQKSAINGRYQMAHVAGYVHYQSEQISEILTIFNERYLEMGQGWGFFDDAVMAIGHTLANIQQKIPVLKKTALLENHFEDIPVFIVGNGPSLDGLIDSIKAHQDKAIIISCGSALSALYEYGIKPDFHSEQERTSPVSEKIELYCPAEFLDNITLLAPTTVHPKVFELFNDYIMAAKVNEPSSSLLLRDEQGKDLFSSYHFINPTVANTALVMSYHLGFKNFYLFGIDLGHKKGGAHHSKKSMYYTKDEEDLDLYDIDDTESIHIKGNLGGQFICDRFFYQSNSNLSKQILGYKDLTCFNLSDGAYIEGSTPLIVDELTSHFTQLATIDSNAIKTEIEKNSIFCDENGAMMARLVDDLDYQYFEIVCNKLIKLNEQPVQSFKDAAKLLNSNTRVIRTLTEHAHDLLTGTIMQMQVVLTQLLYSNFDEDKSIEAFNKGVAVYRNFLTLSVPYYKEQAEQAHYINDCDWIVKIKEALAIID